MGIVVYFVPVKGKDRNKRKALKLIKNEKQKNEYFRKQNMHESKTVTVQLCCKVLFPASVLDFSQQNCDEKTTETLFLFARLLSPSHRISYLCIPPLLYECKYPENK